MSRLPRGACWALLALVCLYALLVVLQFVVSGAAAGFVLLACGLATVPAAWLGARLGRRYGATPDR